MSRKTCYEMMDHYYEEAKRKAELKQYERHRGEDEYTFIGYIHNIKPISHGNERFFHVTEDGELIPYRPEENQTPKEGEHHSNTVSPDSVLSR